MINLEQYVTYEGCHHASVEGEKLVTIGEEKNDSSLIKAGELVIKSMAGLRQKTYTFPNGLIANVCHDKNLSNELFKIDLCKKHQDTDMLVTAFEQNFIAIPMANLSLAECKTSLEQIFTLPNAISNEEIVEKMLEQSKTN